MILSVVKRIFPESKTALINWIEENFHEIDGYIVTFKMKDDTTMTIYDSYSYLEAVGIAEITKETIHELMRNDEFVEKERN